MKAGGGGVCNMSIDNLTFDFCTFFFAEDKGNQNGNTIQSKL